MGVDMYSYVVSLIVVITLLVVFYMHDSSAVAVKPKIDVVKTVSYKKSVLPGPIPAKIINVIDGDTVKAEVMIWPGQYVQTYIRINGIDTPEHRGRCSKEKELAKQATNLLENTIPETQDVFLYNIHNGKFAGRVVADIKTLDGTSVAQTMLSKAELARPYNGKEKRKPWCNSNST